MPDIQYAETRWADCVSLLPIGLAAFTSGYFSQCKRFGGQLRNAGSAGLQHGITFPKESLVLFKGTVAPVCVWAKVVWLERKNRRRTADS